MFKVLVTTSCAVLLCAQTALADEAERFVGQVALPNGQTVVVAEGDLEARARGSYSVRLYEAAKASDTGALFVSGIVMPRMGTVERVMVSDPDSDGEPEVVVMTRSVGTGGKRSARVFDVLDGRIDPLITVDDLPADADVLDALKARATVRDEVKKRQADRLKK
ncbi:PliI family lysozyme inhibitor of I-type lysozyme [Nitrogeniibacter aestuarii]|uniref:PliI family lysozyme inhibitor of I-type lysozyme n=1 Tax=Nitrogeniibacter aestuarii TaxID=2815343 RepID=UPI001E3BEBA3|nr:PliI family lysozyme inhibitor of I-type lysozyme [Nitrogeniibacter aestuarii]